MLLFILMPVYKSSFWLAPLPVCSFPWLMTHSTQLWHLWHLGVFTGLTFKPLLGDHLLPTMAFAQGFPGTHYLASVAPRSYWEEPMIPPHGQSSISHATKPRTMWKTQSSLAANLLLVVANTDYICNRFSMLMFSRSRKLLKPFPLSQVELCSSAECCCTFVGGNFGFLVFFSAPSCTCCIVSATLAPFNCKPV